MNCGSQATLRQFRDLAAFYARALPFLAQREAEHNLMIGLCASRLSLPTSIEPDIFLATLESAGQVVGAALQTPPHNLVLSLFANLADLAPLVSALALQRPDLPGVLGPRAVAAAFGQAWRERTGRSVALAMAQRIYVLEVVTPVVGVAGALRPAGVDDRALLLAWLPAAYIEMRTADARSAQRQAANNVAIRLNSEHAGYALWTDDEPVCLVGYGGPTPHGIRIGPVYTPPSFRRRGYASAAVAALSQLLLERGSRYCFLYTDLANPTSNAIYQNVGYRAVSDVDLYTFGPPDTP